MNKENKIFIYLFKYLFIYFIFVSSSLGGMLHVF